MISLLCLLSFGVVAQINKQSVPEIVYFDFSKESSGVVLFQLNPELRRLLDLRNEKQQDLQSKIFRLNEVEEVEFWDQSILQIRFKSEAQLSFAIEKVVAVFQQNLKARKVLGVLPLPNWMSDKRKIKILDLVGWVRRYYGDGKSSSTTYQASIIVGSEPNIYASTLTYTTTATF